MTLGVKDDGRRKSSPGVDKQKRYENQTRIMHKIKTMKELSVPDKSSPGMDDKV